MKMKKFIAVVSMVGMLAAAMTGCGSGSDDAKDADKGGDAKYAGDWDSANDITVVSREDGSGTRGAFIELFGIQEEVDGEKAGSTIPGDPGEGPLLGSSLGGCGGDRPH